MSSETYTLEQFVADLDRITSRESEPEAITTQIAPLLARLVKNHDAIPAGLRGRAPDGGRGRFMLHRAPRFNVTSVVWRPGDRAGAHNHETRSRRRAIACWTGPPAGPLCRCTA